MSKVAFTVLVIGPFATTSGVGLVGLLIGIIMGFLLALWDYLLDGMEVTK